MSASATKPTILLVHGLWHRPAHYTPLIDLLSSHGFKVVTPALPSTGGELHHGLLADAHVVEKTIEDLVTAEENVLIVAHSYGGIVVTEALKVHETRKARSMIGKKGGVLGIAFIAAFVFTPGQTLLGALGGSFPPFTPIDGEGKLVMTHSKERFVYNSPPKETQEWLEVLAPVSVNTHTEQIRNCGYLYVPNLYIYTTEDKAIVHSIQKKMIHAAKVFGGDFEEETIEDGHSPFATKPDTVVQIILKHLDAGRWNVVGFSDDEATVQGNLLGEGLQQLGGIMVALGEIPGGP